MGTVVIVRGTNDKPASSQALVRHFTEHPDCNGQLFVGYPIIGTSEGRHRIDALLVSPERGVVIFDLVEGSDAGDFDARQDDAANKLEAKLKAHRDLMQRRQLLVPVHTVTFAPAITDPSSHAASPDYPLANLDTLTTALQTFTWAAHPPHLYEQALSTLQSVSTIRKGRIRRVVQNETSRGAKLKRLEDSIATLDKLQSAAVIETVDDVQRIRGLAGSGKTIVLALKAAYLHAQHPDWRIAVTFNTRSLKAQFRRLINTFCIEQTGEEPDWEQLRVLNAWGAPGGDARDGIYHQFCQAHQIDYYDFRSARDQFSSSNAFAGACTHALTQNVTRRDLYDAVLVDEAQDFPPQFLRLCYELLGARKRLVYAYDELQTLSGAGLPSPSDIFGLDELGRPRVSFDGPESSRRDIILRRCYRNSRPVLVTAHALGFGINRVPPKGRSTGLIQMFDQPQLWEEIGYRRESGELRPGAPVHLARDPEASPAFLENHSDIDDIVQFRAFASPQEQANWVAEQIKINLTQDELRHDDIVVINPDPLSTRKEVGPIRARLLDHDINSHLAGVDTDPDVFYKPETQSITFTGIYRAKGNEAGMAYIINAHDCHAAAWNLASIRNRLFTGITRSKAWVRVLGVGPAMQGLIDEFNVLKQQNFELRFTFPTKEQREEILIVHRDVSKKERERLTSREQELRALVDDLEAGNLHTEDLDEDLRRKLVEFLARNG